MRGLALLLAALAPPALALDLALPPGAALAHEEASPADAHRLATGPWADGGGPALEVEGAVTRQAWRVPGRATTAALMASLRDQLEAQGLAVLFACDAARCGGFDFRLEAEVLPPPAMFVDLGDFRYLAAAGDGEWASLLVSRGGGAGFVQVIRVAAPPAAPSAAPPAAPPPPAGEEAPGGLAARLAREGRAVLAGLDFAPGSAALGAEIGPGGEEGLAALAAFLAADPSRRVVLVGHTDAQGPLAANLDLSRRRAAAVAQRLAGAHGADPAQIGAEGAGFLAPLASNATDEGRRANRRVEAVLLPPAGAPEAPP